MSFPSAEHTRFYHRLQGPDGWPVFVPPGSLGADHGLWTLLAPTGAFCGLAFGSMRRHGRHTASPSRADRQEKSCHP